MAPPPQRRPHPRPDGPEDLSDDFEFSEALKEITVPLRDVARTVATWIVAALTAVGSTVKGWVESIRDDLQARRERRAGDAADVDTAEEEEHDGSSRSWWKVALVGTLLLIALAVAAPVVAIYSLPAVATAGGPAGWAVETFLSVPDIDHELQLEQRSVLYAADGSSLGMLVGEHNRVLADLDEIPDVVEQAVVATEDANYYEHDGIDRRGILRAAITNLRSGEVEQGASTITQQYVKNALLTPERSLSRKVTEAVTAVRLEEELSKEQILERYLNLAYFGNGAYGVEAASQYYFGTPIEEISVGQAAMLAGMIRLPERNNPVDNLDAAMARRDVVLGQMLREGYIDQEQYEVAKAETWTDDLVTPPPAPEYAFFNEYIKKLLLNEEALGEDRSERAAALFGGGLRIHTTLVPSMQDQAMETIADHISDPAADPLAGLVSLDPRSGAVLSMAIGPKGFGECNEDGCTTTKVNPLVPGQGGSGRQAGSAFKPIVAATALAEGLPSDWHTDTEPRPIEGCGANGTEWEPHNYSDSADRKGVIDLYEATRTSNNVFYAHLIDEVGPAKVADMANRLGIRTEVPPYCSIALGTPEVYPIDMARVYGTFANGGVSCAPQAITRVENAAGEVLVEYEPQCERVLDENVAGKVNRLLSSVVTSGTGTAANIGRPMAGKTGTTDDYRDAWFVGYTPQVVTASWLGFEHPKPMENVLGLARISGGSMPAVVWGDYMVKVMEAYDPEPLLLADIDRYVPPPEPKPKPKRKKARDDKPPKDEEVEVTSEPVPQPTETSTTEPSPEPTASESSDDD